MTMPDKPMVDNGPAIPDNLPALLQRAAQILPDRFMVLWIDNQPHLLARHKGNEDTDWLFTPSLLMGDWHVEYACREEIEARGWQWVVKAGEAPGRYSARVYVGAKGHADVRHGMDPTPAQALLAALLSAVEATA